jgi:WD40 repeat protein
LPGEQLNFIGISRNNQREMVTYTAQRINKILFDFKIFSLVLIRNGQLYAIMGREEGKIVVFDVEKQKILATLQETHNGRIEHLSLFKSNERLLVSGKNTNISIYKLNVFN